MQKKDEFLKWWMTDFPTYKNLSNDNYDSKFREFFDFKAIDESMSAFTKSPYNLEQSRVSSRLWVGMFLNMWLIREHAVVEALGHGNPEDALYEELVKVLSDSHERHAKGKTPSTDFERAVEIAVPEFDVTIKDIDGSTDDAEGSRLRQIGQCALIIRLKDEAPRDAVVFGFDVKGDSKEWKIVRTGWLSL